MDKIHFFKLYIGFKMERNIPGVWENIFSSLSIRDLLLSASLVCKSWRDIIASDHFCPQKKGYYAALLLKPGHVEDFRVDLEALKETKIEMPTYYSVPSVLEHVNGQPMAVEPGHRPHDVLLHHFADFCFAQLKKLLSTYVEPKPHFAGVSRHSKYRMVSAILQQRFPSHADDPLSAVMAICLLAQG